MLLKLKLTVTLALAVLLVQVAGQTAQAKVSRVERIRVDINWYRQKTWQWQEIMLHNHTRTVYAERHTVGIQYLRWIRRLWTQRDKEAKAQALHPPHESAWNCIHRYEGSWTDPNSPYYGGLQMDLGFQRTYGGNLLREKGTADNWTPLEQMWVAERAFSSGRGFYPWPNTARWCGLI